MTRKVQLRSPVKHILFAQAGATVLVAMALAWHGRVAAYSALTGGLICLAANAYAAWRAFNTTTAESAAGVLSNLYRAEVGKLVTIGALFIAVFTGWEEVNIGAFIAGSIAALIAGAVSPAFQRDWNIPDKGQAGTQIDG